MFTYSYKKILLKLKSKLFKRYIKIKAKLFPYHSNTYEKYLLSYFFQNYFEKREISIVSLLETWSCRVTRR